MPGDRRDPPRTSWILVSEKTVGSKNVAVGVNETEPGCMVPEHEHETEEEVMFFISGEGKFVTEDRGVPRRSRDLRLQPSRGKTQDPEHRQRGSEVRVDLRAAAREPSGAEIDAEKERSTS